MKPVPTRALYAGSFDPITRGHLDVIRKALQTFDLVHVGVGTNPLKDGLFDTAERLALIRSCLADEGLEGEAVDVGAYSGESVIRYAHGIGATHLVRGLRQASDFDDEFRYHGVFERLDATIPMVHFICQEAYLHVSSSTARELASLHEDISWLVTPSVERALAGKFTG